jgi:hypothetical protein
MRKYLTNITIKKACVLNSRQVNKFKAGEEHTSCLPKDSFVTL